MCPLHLNKPRHPLSDRFDLRSGLELGRRIHRILTLGLGLGSGLGLGLGLGLVLGLGLGLGWNFGEAGRAGG